MDWDGNQESIRKMLARADALMSEMIYEDDHEVRGDLAVHVSRDIHDVLAMTENMTRHLKKRASYRLKKGETPLNEDGTFKVLSYDQLEKICKDLLEENKRLRKAIENGKEIR